MISGSEIKRLREARSLSQSELARGVGCAQPIIHGLETGKRRHSIYLRKIAAALGVEIGQLDSDFSPEPPIEQFKDAWTRPGSQSRCTSCVQTYRKRNCAMLLQQFYWLLECRQTRIFQVTPRRKCACASKARSCDTVGNSLQGAYRAPSLAAPVHKTAFGGKGSKDAPE